ncbi:ABC transporter permease [Gracilimonas sp.]|uniref:ABC transporter permease n=1 Tax=Gracilimonas sp. TaxID=1974203 RepID=UPI0032ED2352
MLRNYFKIAFRNLTRQKLYASINIFGLALGLASFFVIGTWVYQQWSYDRHFDQSQQIYRVGVNFFNVGDMAVGPPVFDSVIEEFPEVALSTSLDMMGPITIKYGDKEIEQPGTFSADKDFFDIFSYQFLVGNPENALDEPNQVVLSESVAQKMFRTTDVLSKSVLIGDDEVPHTITGVIRENSLKTHFTTKVWLSLERDPEATSWTSASMYNYVLLRPGFTEDDLKNRLNKLIETQIYPTLNLTQPYEEWSETSSAYHFVVKPLTDLHLKTSLRFDFFTPGNATNVYASAAIALFIILLAAINFINISTARSSGRAKEVGIRKTLGSKRSALIKQFLTESVIISLIAFLIGLALGELFLKLFEQFTGIHLMDALLLNFGQVLVFTVVTLLLGLLAGMYPAFYLSGFNPISMLKNNFGGIRKSGFRNGLVITQFTIAISLIISTIVVFQQIQFLQEKDLGFETENVLVVNNISSLDNQQESFRQDILNLSGVQTASFSRRIPIGEGVWVRNLKTPEMSESTSMQVFLGDENYVGVMGFHLLEGRNFSRELASDSSAIILSTSAVKELGLTDPLGARLNDDLTVIGVVDDFNFQSLQNDIEPTAIIYSPSGGDLAIKINKANPNDLLSAIQSIWSAYDIAEPMSYFFLDEQFRQMFNNERALGKTITLFSIFALIISCLGLFGLASYICEQRAKEIGIRKVLGAAVSNLILLLNKDFTRLILISIALAVPLSYFIMNKWLANFAYKIEINPLIYLIAGLSTLLVAWVTVSGQSIKTAFLNPIKTLRSE